MNQLIQIAPIILAGRFLVMLARTITDGYVKQIRRAKPAEVKKMYTRTLVVGQKVWMRSGPYYGQEVKVVKVTERFVEVELLRAEGPIGLKYGIRFDANGKACDSRDIYEGNMEWGGIPGTYEFGPWELELMEDERQQ